MSVIAAVVQQPAEVIDYDVDCTSLFNGDSDTLTSATATVSPVGLTVLAGVEDANTAKVWIGPGGTDGVEYTVTLTAESVGGRIKEDEIIVTIEEV